MRFIIDFNFSVRRIKDGFGGIAPSLLPALPKAVSSITEKVPELFPIGNGKLVESLGLRHIEHKNFPPRFNKGWSRSEEIMLKNAIKNQEDAGDLARRLGRTLQAIYFKARLMGLPTKGFMRFPAKNETAMVGSRICPICNGKFMNYRGMMIHRSKCLRSQPKLA